MVVVEEAAIAAQRRRKGDYAPAHDATMSYGCALAPAGFAISSSFVFLSHGCDFLSEWPQFPPSGRHLIGMHAHACWF